jgi:parallel beta-helix repeat protein
MGRGNGGRLRGWARTALVGASFAICVVAPEVEASPDCGAVVTGSESLDRDLICTVDPALTIDGGRLNLNDFAVICDGTSTGVVIEGQNARLTFGAVTGCAVAVVVGGIGDHLVHRVVAGGSTQGILVESEHNRIVDNAVLRGAEDAAIQVDGSDNRLYGNAVTGSLDQGFEIRGDRNLITRNRVGGIAEGVELRGARNQLWHNDIVGATDTGIELREGADGNVIGFNRIADGAADGITVRSNDNAIRENAIDGSGDQGFFVFEGASGNTFEDNRVLGSGTTDVVDQNPNCDDNDWRGNTFVTSLSDDCID